MASIYRDRSSRVYHITFRFGGKQLHKSLKTTSQKEAEALRSSVEMTIRAVEQGWMNLPPDADPWQFLLSGGTREQKIILARPLTLTELFERYEASIPEGALEPNTLATTRGHAKHLKCVFGPKHPVAQLGTADLQDYINRRVKAIWRGQPIKPRTVRKELATLRSVWNWAVRYGLLTVPAPTRGLVYPKEAPKQPFLSWSEIEERIARGGVSKEQVDELWDSLFLDVAQVDQLLDDVRECAAFPFIYPMFTFVAHTGARRSEMRRSKVEDIDFRGGEVVLREKKRDRSKQVTFRRVWMSDRLRAVLSDWLGSAHPGGPFTFCHGQIVARSRKRSLTTGHQSAERRGTTCLERASTVRARTERPGPESLTPKEADHHFTKTIAGTRWEVIKGFHVLRHSFASNLARKGEDQRVIDELMGHQTEEMRKRYRHLFPEQRENAVRKLFAFGGAAGNQAG